VTDTLDWIEKATEIPEGGLHGTRAATAVELKRVAEALNILAVESLSSRYRIVAISGGAYQLTGSISAKVEQACVVSLEPVSGNVNATFDVEFWPSLNSEESDDEASILSGSDVEILEHGVVPVGRIAFETLSASLDPYPRRAGAEFTWQDPKSEASGTNNPFAALAKLKDKS
jgi:uncharacterized metal-binding protein YceD (DUF177 family)